MYSRKMKHDGQRSFFLFGPRGTGKSTWLRQTLPHDLFVDLLDSETYTRLLAQPNRLDALIPPRLRELGRARRGSEGAGPARRGASSHRDARPALRLDWLAASSPSK